jgi:hypothetical protein
MTKSTQNSINNFFLAKAMFGNFIEFSMTKSTQKFNISCVLFGSKNFPTISRARGPKFSYDFFSFGLFF